MDPVSKGAVSTGMGEYRVACLAMDSISWYRGTEKYLENKMQNGKEGWINMGNVLEGKINRRSHEIPSD